MGDEYAWSSAIFYFGYLAWSWPNSYLLARLPIGKYLGTTVYVLLTAATIYMLTSADQLPLGRHSHVSCSQQGLCYARDGPLLSGGGRSRSRPRIRAYYGLILQERRATDTVDPP